MRDSMPGRADDRSGGHVTCRCAYRASVGAAPRMTVAELLAAARARLPDRPGPDQLRSLTEAGALVVDIRPTEQRSRDGALPGAVVIDRNVLEWRLDPASPHRIVGMEDYERVVVLVCNEGYASSLAAATLQELGLVNATDLDGGFQAWRGSRSGASDPGGTRG